MGIRKENLIKGTTQTQDDTNNPSMGSVTTSFLLSMDDMLDGTVDTFESSAPLLWFYSREERVSSGKSAGDFKASATLIHSLLELHIPTDSYMPTLRQALRDNTNIVEVKITRVGHTDGSSNVELYTSTFGDCKLDGIEEFPDKLILYVRVYTRSDEATAVDTTGAEGEGNTASSWDYSTNASTAS